ncbi:unnamed protein product, partial [Effrenium voratum]
VGPREFGPRSAGGDLVLHHPLLAGHQLFRCPVPADHRHPAGGQRLAPPLPQVLALHGCSAEGLADSVRQRPLPGAGAMDAAGRFLRPQLRLPLGALGPPPHRGGPAGGKRGAVLAVAGRLRPGDPGAALRGEHQRGQTRHRQERRVGVLAQRGRERLGAAGACGAVGVHPGAEPGGQGELELNFNLRQVSR